MKDTVPISRLTFIEKDAFKVTLPHTVLLDDESQTESKLTVYAKKSSKKGKLKTFKDLCGWEDIKDIISNVSVKWDQTKVHIKMPTPWCESYIYIVGAHPKAYDRKRMLIVPFWKATDKEKEEYVVSVYLLDDINNYVQNFCKNKIENGFVKLSSEVHFFMCYDPEKDVEISLTNLETGWKLGDYETKTIEFERYWNAGQSTASCTFRLQRCDLKRNGVSFTINACHKSTQLSLSEDIKVYHTLCERKVTVQKINERQRMKDFVISAIDASEEILDLMVHVLESYQSGFRRLSPTAKSKKCDKNKKRL